MNVRERIVRGDLGKIYYVDSQRVNLGLHQFDINVLWDLGPHDVSITLYWLDEEPEWVQSVGACYTQPDIEDVVFLTMGFPSGAIAMRPPVLPPSLFDGLAGWARKMTFASLRPHLASSSLARATQVLLFVPSTKS